MLHTSGVPGRTWANRAPDASVVDERATRRDSAVAVAARSYASGAETAVTTLFSERVRSIQAEVGLT